MINIENNFIENKEFINIEELYTNSIFKYSVNTKSNVLHFYHIFIFDNKTVSPYTNILEPIINKINKKINHAMFVLIPKTQKKELVFKKEDTIYNEENKSGYYFCNTNSGSLRFVNMKDINPTQNQALIFSKSLKPENYSSTDTHKAYIYFEF